MVSLNVTGAAHYVVLPANSSLPAVVDPQALTTQDVASLFAGNNVTASGDLNILAAFNDTPQVVLVCFRPPGAPHCFQFAVVLLGPRIHFASAAAVACDMRPSTAALLFLC